MWSVWRETGDLGTAIGRVGKALHVATLIDLGRAE